MRRCSEHWLDEAIHDCHGCGTAICRSCLVPAGRRGVLCVRCALVRSGVRVRA